MLPSAFLQYFYPFFFYPGLVTCALPLGDIRLLTCLQSLFPYVTGNTDKPFTWDHICVSFCTVPTAMCPFLLCLHSLVYIAKYILAWFFFLIIFIYPLPARSLVLGRSHSSPFQPLFHYLLSLHLTFSFHLHLVFHPADLMPLNTSPHNLRK